MKNLNVVRTIKKGVTYVLAVIVAAEIIYIAYSGIKKEKYPKVMMMPITNPVTEITIDGITYEVPDGYTIIETENGFYGYGEKVIITKTDIKKDLIDDRTRIYNGETYRIYPVTITPKVKDKNKELTKSE